MVYYISFVAKATFICLYFKEYHTNFIHGNTRSWTMWSTYSIDAVYTPCSTCGNDINYHVPYTQLMFIFQDAQKHTTILLHAAKLVYLIFYDKGYPISLTVTVQC